MDTSPSIYQQPPRPSFFRTRLGEFVLLFFILYYTLAATILLFIVHERPRQEEISASKALLPLLPTHYLEHYFKKGTMANRTKL